MIMENWLAVIFVLAFILALGALILIYSKKEKRVSAKQLARIAAAKKKVEDLLSRKDPDLAKQALIEADKLTDNILKLKMQGRDMGERLKSSRRFFPEREVYQGVWEAHKLRNRVVHEVDFRVTEGQLRKAIGDFKKGWKILGY